MTSSCDGTRVRRGASEISAILLSHVRTVHTIFATDSANTNDDLAEMLWTQQGADIWKIDAEGSVDLRMSRDLYTSLSKKIPDCHLLVDNVEDLVQEAEQAMFSPKANIWEELLTEEVDDEMASSYYGIARTNFQLLSVTLSSQNPNRVNKSRPISH